MACCRPKTLNHTPSMFRPYMDVKYDNNGHIWQRLYCKYTFCLLIGSIGRAYDGKSLCWWFKSTISEFTVGPSEDLVSVPAVKFKAQSSNKKAKRSTLNWCKAQQPKRKAKHFTKPWKHGLPSEYVVAGSSTRLGGSKSVLEEFAEL